MSRNIRAVLSGAILLVACAACTDDGSSTSAATPEQFSSLETLAAVSESDDILADLPSAGSAAPARVVGEVRKGQERILAYVQGNKCGLVGASTTGPKKVYLHLVSGWPKDGEDSARPYSGGPYSIATGAGTGTTPSWASLSCSHSAMVISYQSEEVRPAGKPIGQAAFREKHGHPAELIIVIGSDRARAKILPEVAPSGATPVQAQ
ncbi:hypothetical protein [Streptomyces melanogenes]|uniref:hypothetical protein n=1 Tax=Streptomyces melanogenes TaxID=67326 RepID=UPI0037B0EE69